MDNILKIFFNINIQDIPYEYNDIPKIKIYFIRLSNNGITKIIYKNKKPTV